MRKTLIDLASYLKEILVPEATEAYTIGSAYTNISTEENIREGILALRAFLAHLLNTIIMEGDAYDTPKKLAHEYENRTTLSGYYPFLYNVNSMLINIGYHGVLSENGSTLLCDNHMFSEKLSISKTLECLQFLMDCGICFGGIDLNDKKQNLSDNKAITITYPDNPAMLTGLKVMAIAEKDYRTLINQDVLLRCDYRVLKQDEIDAISILQDTIKSLSADVQEFILLLHQRYLDKGLVCVVEIKGYHIYIKYMYRRKDVWGLNVSLNNGYHINVKPTKLQEYADIIAAFSPSLRKIIAQGYGCGRKRAEIGHCDGGCRGLPIPLGDAIGEMRDDIVTWFDQELSCLQAK